MNIELIELISQGGLVVAAVAACIVLWRALSTSTNERIQWLEDALEDASQSVNEPTEKS